MDKWSQPFVEQVGTAAPPPRARAIIDEAIRRAEWLGSCHAPEPTIPAGVSVPGYEINRGIASGGQGHVYQATQTSTGKRVAIKIIHRSAAANEIDQVRFQREVEALATLRHPNIVTLHDGGTANGNRFIVTDYIDGVSFDAYVNRTWLGVDAIVGLFVKVCDAAAAAHVRGIVHRDLKPSNILVDERGEPQMIDFGLAKLLERPGDDGLTTTGKFVGSLPWAAPEQVDGSLPGTDTRTDVYALGLVLFHAITGRLPYDTTGSPRRTMEAIVSASPTTPTALGARIDQDLQTILNTCLKKSPQQRYQTAGEVARELRRYLAHEPIEAKRDSTLYMVRKTIRRHRALAAIVFALLAGGVAYAWTATVLLQEARLAQQQAAESADQAIRHAQAQRETLAFMVGEVSSKLASMPVTAPIRRNILEGAFERLTKLAANQVLGDDVRVTQADTCEQLGDIARDLGDWESAARHFEQAYQTREKALQADPDDRAMRAALSIGYVKYGDVLQFLGDPAARRVMYERALEIDEALHEEKLDDVSCADNLVWSYERLGSLAREARDYDQARRRFEQQRGLCEQLFASDPDSTQGLFALLRSVRQICELEQIQDHMQQARQLADEQLHMAETFADEHAESHSAAYHLAVSCMFSERHALNVGDTEQAKRVLDRAADVAQVFDSMGPDPKELRLLVAIHEQLTDLASGRHEFKAALTYGKDHLRIAEHLRRVAPYDVTMADQVFRASKTLALISFAAGWSEEQRLYIDQSLSEADQILRDGFYPEGFVRAFAGFLASHYTGDRTNPNRAIELLKHHMETTRVRTPDDEIVLASLYCTTGSTEEGVAILRRNWTAGTPHNALERHKYEEAFRECGSELIAKSGAKTHSTAVR